MSRIAIVTCSNSTRDLNCSAVGCFEALSHRNGFFQRYPATEPLDIVGMISCAGCPTSVAPERILRRIDAVVSYGIDALHLAYCMVHLCPFRRVYREVITRAYPTLVIVEGTHAEGTFEGQQEFRHAVREMLAPTVIVPRDMNDFIKSHRTPREPSR